MPHDAWTQNYAHRCVLFDAFVYGTQSQRVANSFRGLPVLVLFRRTSLSGEHFPRDLLYVVGSCGDNVGCEFRFSVLHLCPADKLLLAKRSYLSAGYQAARSDAATGHRAIRTICK